MTRLAHTREELAQLLAPARRRGEQVGLVPTMGALHEGHASLVDTARAATDGPVVVSVFVNPLQFAAGEDLERYPRTLDADLALCEARGVDVVWAPTVAEVYPTAATITVDPGPLGTVLEGATRPTHFRGVLTVVAKLLGLVRPDVAVFGEKDYQQLVLVRRMALELCLGVEVIGAETVREADGLARSSRNVYLDADERRRAAALSRALRAARDASGAGVDAVLDAARAELAREGTGPTGIEVDYLALTTPDLGELPADPAPGTPARVLVEARVGATRLLDNLPLVLGAPAGPQAHPQTRTPGSTAPAAGTTTSTTTMERTP